jgi:hypothetical protein
VAGELLMLKGAAAGLAYGMASDAHSRAPAAVVQLAGESIR